MLRKVRVSAPGKIILSGEHAVVYGYPEILSAIDKRFFVEIEEAGKGLSVQPLVGKTIVEYAIEVVKRKLNVSLPVNLRVEIDSQIPIGSGLGSSAAFAVAITAAFFEFLKLPRSLKKMKLHGLKPVVSSPLSSAELKSAEAKDFRIHPRQRRGLLRRRINEIAYEIEKKQHGTPSGGDNTVSTYGGFLLFRKETETFKVFSSLKTKVFPQIFLINSGKPEENTGEMVKMVKDFVLKSPKQAERIFLEMEKITRIFLRFLSGEESNFSDLIKRNERLLEELGVVSPKTRALVRKIESLGGSAKISGAGGVKGNSGIVLAYHQDPKILLELADKEKLDVISVKLGAKGVKNEQN